NDLAGLCNYNALIVSGVYFTSFTFYSKQPLTKFLSLARAALPPSGASLPGGHMPGAPPVPIPNTAVKPRAANGSWTIGPARVGHRQVFGPVAVNPATGPSSFYTLSTTDRRR